jgi:hypothetical protein
LPISNQTSEKECSPKIDSSAVRSSNRASSRSSSETPGGIECATPCIYIYMALLYYSTLLYFTLLYSASSRSSSETPGESSVRLPIYIDRALLYSTLLYFTLLYSTLLPGNRVCDCLCIYAYMYVVYMYTCVYARQCLHSERASERA